MSNSPFDSLWKNQGKKSTAAKAPVSYKLPDEKFDDSDTESAFVSIGMAMIRCNLKDEEFVDGKINLDAIWKRLSAKEICEKYAELSFEEKDRAQFIKDWSATFEDWKKKYPTPYMGMKALFVKFNVKECPITDEIRNLIAGKQNYTLDELRNFLNKKYTDSYPTEYLQLIQYCSDFKVDVPIPLPIQLVTEATQKGSNKVSLQWYTGKKLPNGYDERIFTSLFDGYEPYNLKISQKLALENPLNVDRLGYIIVKDISKKEGGKYWNIDTHVDLWC